MRACDRAFLVFGLAVVESLARFGSVSVEEEVSCISAPHDRQALQAVGNEKGWGTRHQETSFPHRHPQTRSQVVSVYCP